ncbi:hypothetical protein MFUL124B02_39270 [Myxococcus fulvus 124B02]|nr:hypothetical protein MFUL124B02_39270 [Myxococcus fulvus 124B02]
MRVQVEGRGAFMGFEGDAVFGSEALGGVASGRLGGSMG